MNGNNPNENIENLDFEPVSEPVKKEEAPKQDVRPRIGSIGINPLPVSNVDLSRRENIGIIPPKKDEPTLLTPKNKMIFIIVVVSLIFLVGFGVFYYLHITNTRIKNMVKTKDIVSEVGVLLSTNPNDYATFNGISSSNCYINTAAIDVNKVGKHEYIITCGELTYAGIIEIKDYTAPVVKTQNIIKTIGSEIKPEDFIVSCEDASKCNYGFNDEKAVRSYLNDPGTYDIAIKVSDSSGNSVVVGPTLTVVDGTITAYLQCSSSATLINDYFGLEIIRDRFAINVNNDYLGIAERRREYSYFNSNDYNTLKSSNLESSSFKGIEGKLEFDDESYKIFLTSKLDSVMLNTEFGSEFPKTYNEIKTYYESKGYSCSAVEE